MLSYMITMVKSGEKPKQTKSIHSLGTTELVHYSLITYMFIQVLKEKQYI